MSSIWNVSFASNKCQTGFILHPVIVNKLQSNTFFTALTMRRSLQASFVSSEGAGSNISESSFIRWLTPTGVSRTSRWAQPQCLNAHDQE